MFHTMRTTIDHAGRIVIPKPIRSRLGLTGGQAVEVVEHDGAIEITPAATEMRLEERDGRLVAVADEELPVLTDDMVREALDRSRR